MSVIVHARCVVGTIAALAMLAGGGCRNSPLIAAEGAFRIEAMASAMTSSGQLVGCREVHQLLGVPLGQNGYVLPRWTVRADAEISTPVVQLDGTVVDSVGGWRGSISYREANGDSVELSSGSIAGATRFRYRGRRFEDGTARGTFTCALMRASDMRGTPSDTILVLAGTWRLFRLIQAE